VSEDPTAKPELKVVLAPRRRRNSAHCAATCPASKDLPRPV
jgi:hypothetical protein